MSTSYTPPQRRILANGEIGATLASLGLQPTSASPLAAHATERGSRVERDEAAVRALRILAAPSVSLQQRHGGPLLAFGLSTACLGTGDAGVAVARPYADDRLELLLYADARSFVDDWLDAYSSAADEEVANLLPPPLPLGSLPLVLHAIDAFRRASYQSALCYASSEPLSIRVAEFNDSLRAASASSDLRWLLPAFLQLTPGLDFGKLTAADVDPGVLAQNDLLTLPLAGAAAVFGFGTTGHLLGSEFIGGWHGAAGLALYRHGANADETLARVFIAPTHLTNHWFALANDGQSVNHQPLRVSVLAQRLDDLLSGAVLEPEPGLASVLASPSCPLCGQPVGANARFCGSCGHALSG